MTVAIGIDLGTTYSCIGVVEGAEVSIIQNEICALTTPSYVHLGAKGPPVVGRSSKTQVYLDPAEVLYDVKRLIGRRFTDPVVQNEIQLWPFEVVSDDGIPKLRVRGKTYHPEEISAKILAHLKSNAEDYLGVPVSKAVITVPAYFSNGQRQATKDAGEIAGLEVLRIINEPTAAAIAYCHSRPTGGNQKLLVFDLGGGTFDVVVLSIDAGNIDVLAVGGDTHLGGEDFDRSLVDYCIREFEKETSINLRNGKVSSDEMKRKKSVKILQRLKTVCEEEKITLTSARETTVSLPAVHGELDLVVKVSRETFNSLNEALFLKCINIVDKTLKEVQMTQGDIDNVILVGGSSRIPKIQSLITEYFGGRKPSLVMRGDLAVAHGAAIVASMLSKSSGVSTTKLDLNLNINFRDVVPAPIGISALGPNADHLEFFPIVNKNAPVPCMQIQTFHTAIDNAKPLIRVYEGEEKDPEKNFFLGEFDAKNLPMNCLEGEPFWVHIHVNEEGILEVKMSYRTSGVPDKYKLEARTGRLGKEELLRLKLENASLSN